MIYFNHILPSYHGEILLLAYNGSYPKVYPEQQLKIYQIYIKCIKIYASIT